MIKKLIPLIIIFFMGVYLVSLSIYHIFIGNGKIKHPMYDTPEKLIYLKRKWTVGLILSSIPTLFLLIVLFLIFMSL